MTAPMTPDLLTLYRSLFLVRWTEEEIARQYPKGRMKNPVHLSLGQESASVGVIAVLDKEDHVYGGHRSHAAYLAKGGSVDALVAELHGRATGCASGLGGSMHIADEMAGFMGAYPIVGDAVSIATGAALAFKLSQSRRRAVVFSGDAVPETGQFWEALNFASLHALPVLYVVEDNGYATQTPIQQRQPQRSSLAHRVAPWMDCITVPDHDVRTVIEATQGALTRLPCVLHIHTYRYRKHVGPEYDWDMGYRPRDEVEEAMRQDPVDFARRTLLKMGLEREVETIELAIRREVTDAFRKAEEAPWPGI